MSEHEREEEPPKTEPKLERNNDRHPKPADLKKGMLTRIRGVLTGGIDSLENLREWF